MSSLSMWYRVWDDNSLLRSQLNLLSTESMLSWSKWVIITLCDSTLWVTTLFFINQKWVIIVEVSCHNYMWHHPLTVNVLFVDIYSDLSYTKRVFIGLCGITLPQITHFIDIIKWVRLYWHSEILMITYLLYLDRQATHFIFKW